MTTIQKPVYRMSSAGCCPKRLSAIRNMIECEPTPDWLERTAEEGHRHEIWIKEEMGSEFIISDEQKELVIDLGNCALVGHIDGIAIPYEETGEIQYLLEIKTKSQYEFDRWMKGGFAAFPEHAGQLACYFEGTGLKEALYYVKNRSSGYIDKRLVQQETNHLFDFDVIKHKILEIEEYAMRGELIPADYDINSIECKRCEFKHLCLPAPKQINGVDSKVIQSAINSWRSGNQLEKKAKELIGNAKEILQAYAAEQPEKKFMFDRLVTSVYSVAEAPVSYVRKAYTACKITDLRKEDDDRS